MASSQRGVWSVIKIPSTEALLNRRRICGNCLVKQFEQLNVLEQENGNTGCTVTLPVEIFFPQSHQRTLQQCQCALLLTTLLCHNSHFVLDVKAMRSHVLALQ